MYLKYILRCSSHIHNHVTLVVISAVVGINEKLRSVATITLCATTKYIIFERIMDNEHCIYVI